MLIPTDNGGDQANPGRWVGGAVGALVCLGIIGVGQVLAVAANTASSSGPFRPDGFTTLGLGGLPIAILGGRALLPAARSGGWRTALTFGLVLGFLAPPLGAIEIVAVAMLPGSGATSGFGDNAAGFLFLLPIGLVYSYVVVVLTVPAGLAWAVAARAIPQSVLRRFEVPRPLRRFGARHALLVAVTVWTAAMAHPYVVDATDAFLCLDLRPAPGAYAWDAGGLRLSVVADDGSGAARLVLVDVTGHVQPLDERQATWPSLPAVATDGSVGWVASRDADGRTRRELWVADRQGSRSVGALPDERWAALASWDGSWILVGAGTGGLVRVDPQGRTIHIVPAVAAGQRLGSWATIHGISSSADGRTIAWWAVRDWPNEKRFTVANLDGQRQVALPSAAFDPTLDPGGRRVVYRDGPTGSWRSRAISGADDVVLVGDDWSGVRVAANGAIAAVSEAVGRGRLCLAPGAPGPRT